MAESHVRDERHNYQPAISDVNLLHLVSKSAEGGKKSKKW